MVPTLYKGIPEPIKIPSAVDDPNNWTESIFISRSGVEPNIKKNVLTYQANGLPATSTIKEVAGAYQMTQATKYN